MMVCDCDIYLKTTQNIGIMRASQTAPAVENHFMRSICISHRSIGRKWCQVQTSYKDTLTELCCQRPSGPGCLWNQSQPVWTGPPRRDPGWGAPGPSESPETLGSTGPAPAHSRSPCRTPRGRQESGQTLGVPRKTRLSERIGVCLPPLSRSGQDQSSVLLSGTSPHTAGYRNTTQIQKKPKETKETKQKQKWRLR